jgi:multiple sugar transport system ATP-binding protein
MRAEIIKLRKKIDTTFIYVTHDQTESMTLGDRIVIMKDGVIQQVGTPQDLFDHPRNLFVAGFIGMPRMNILDAKLVKKGDKYAVAIGGIEVELSADKQERLAAKNVAPQDVALGVRPEHLTLKGTDLLKGTVDVSEMMGSEIHYHVTCMGKDVIIIVPTIGNVAIGMGQEIAFRFNGKAVHVFDKETGVNLEM